MDFPTLQTELRRIGGQAQALAVIGAVLRLHQTKQQAHPAVQAQLMAALQAVLPGGLDSLDERQISEALSFVTVLIEDASDLFHNPDRAPGWVFRDSTILEAQGQAS